MSQVISPTVGRVMHYHSGPNAEPLPAIVTKVFGDRMVNLAIFDPNGVPYTNPPTSIPLVQPEDELPETGNFCQWMDYQISKAIEETAIGLIENEPEQLAQPGDGPSLKGNSDQGAGSLAESVGEQPGKTPAKSDGGSATPATSSSQAPESPEPPKAPKPPAPSTTA